MQKLLTQARRIAEHREKGSEQEIRRTYQALLKDLRLYLGERYEKLAEEDKLDYATLQRKGEFARFVEVVEQLVIQHTTPVGESVHKTVQDVYSLCWQGLQDAVKQSTTSEALHAALQSIHGITPEVAKRAVENPISGLTLNSRLQKHRQDVIYGIKQQIGIGLTQGDTYTTMTRRVAGEVDGDYKKAIRIVRTETHRVREAGFHDAASDVHKAAQASGYGMTKTWRTMQDERVRPQCRFKRGKHWIMVIRGPYNHQKMEGVCIPVDQQFDLGGGVMTDAPGQSGVAGQDINCRCFLEYSLKKNEELSLANDKEKSYNTPPAEKVQNHQKSLPEKELQRHYKSSVHAGMISPLCGLENYKNQYSRVQNIVVGMETSNGIHITGQSEHFIERIIGTAQDPTHGNYPRSGVEVEDVVDALKNGTVHKVRYTKNRKAGALSASQRFSGKKCDVSVNPDTGVLIQCNLR